MIGKMGRHPGFTIFTVDSRYTRSAVHIHRRFSASVTHNPSPFSVTLFCLSICAPTTRQCFKPGVYYDISPVPPPTWW